jgi:hypothetical protein
MECPYSLQARGGARATAHYHKDGGEVRVSTGGEQASAVLTVVDTGAGIAETDQSHIFERYYRPTNHLSRQRAQWSRVGHLQSHRRCPRRANRRGD